jgi:hypothetical protein
MTSFEETIAMLQQQQLERRYYLVSYSLLAHAQQKTLGGLMVVIDQMTTASGLTPDDVKRTLQLFSETTRDFCVSFKPVEWNHIHIIELTEAAAREITHTISGATAGNDGASTTTVALLPVLLLGPEDHS